MKLSIIALPCALLATFAAALPQKDLTKPAGKTRSSTCLPNYQGANIYIVNDSTLQKWNVRGQSAGAFLSSTNGTTDYWRLEQSGSPTNDFIVKLGNVTDNSIIAAPARKGTRLDLAVIKGAGNPTYNVRCTACSDPGEYPSTGKTLAKGCLLQDATGLGYVTGAGNGANLTLSTLGGKNQQWSMIVV